MEGEGKGREAKGGRVEKKEEYGEEGEGERPGWKEGRKHGKRRHLVQYERHWKEEQEDRRFTGRRRSEYRRCEGAGRGEVKLHTQAKMVLVG